MEDDNDADQIAPFLRKTYDLVDDAGTNDVISWSQAGRSFIVSDPERLAKEVLGTVFKHSNFASFVRQLNTYGFSKIDPCKWEFSNTQFVRGRRDLLAHIKRKKSTPRESAPPAHGPSPRVRGTPTVSTHATPGPAAAAAAAAAAAPLPHPQPPPPHPTGPAPYPRVQPATHVPPQQPSLFMGPPPPDFLQAAGPQGAAPAPPPPPALATSPGSLTFLANAASVPGSAFLRVTRASGGAPGAPGTGGEDGNLGGSGQGAGSGSNGSSYSNENRLHEHRSSGATAGLNGNGGGPGPQTLHRPPVIGFMGPGSDALSDLADLAAAAPRGDAMEDMEAAAAIAAAAAAAAGGPGGAAPYGAPSPSAGPIPLHPGPIDAGLFRPQAVPWSFLAAIDRVEQQHHSIEEKLVKSQNDMEARLQAQFDCRLEKMAKLYEDRLQVERESLQEERDRLNREREELRKEIADMNAKLHQGQAGGSGGGAEEAVPGGSTAAAHRALDLGPDTAAAFRAAGGAGAGPTESQLGRAPSPPDLASEANLLPRGTGPLSSAPMNHPPSTAAGAGAAVPGSLPLSHHPAGPSGKNHPLSHGALPAALAVIPEAAIEMDTGDSARPVYGAGMAGGLAAPAPQKLWPGGLAGVGAGAGAPQEGPVEGMGEADDAEMQ